MKKLFQITAASAALFVGTLTAPVQAKDIVETAVEAGSFNTLATALKAADLVSVLQGEGPFTVFAPTDEAFAKVPSEALNGLLKPENKDKLTAVLTYHVVAGNVSSKQVVELTGATTVNGQRVDIKVEDGKVFVDGAQVVTTDIECDNGVIHVIDSVIMPASDNIVETAKSAEMFGTLLAAAGAAGLADVLGTEELTVFAPTDEAFAKLPEGTVESLLKPENKNKLIDILKYHVVAGRVYSDDALKAESAATLQGAPVTIGVSNGEAMVNKAKLIKTDLDASNGVIHVIDSVLMPPPSNAMMRAEIESAVATGAGLFNSGHHQQCADLYHATMSKMMSSLPQSHRLVGHMSSTISSAESTTCPTTRSWILRNGIDQMYASLGN